MSIKRIHWEDLKEKDWEQLHFKVRRSQAVEESYAIHRRNLARRGLTVCEYIEGKLFQGDELYTFVPNEYPYFFGDSIDHWVLWINPTKKRPSKEKIMSFLRKKLSHKEFLTFENREEDKSVPGVEHIHVLVRRS